MENQQDNNVVVTSHVDSYKVEGPHDHLGAPMGHHVSLSHHLNSHHNSMPLDHHHHHHHHNEELGEEENVEAIVVEHGNPTFNQFGGGDYSNAELVNYGTSDPSPFVSDQNNYANQHAFGPEGDYTAYHVAFDETKVDRKLEKDFVDMIAEYIGVFDGQVYVEFEALMKRFQSRKRNYDHYKMSIAEVIEKNGKKYLPMKEMVRFFESNGFTLHDTYVTWKKHLISQSILHQINKKEKKRKRNEVYDVSSLGLMSSCDCQTSKLVPKKQRLAVKPLSELTDSHYAKLRAVHLMSTIEHLLSNLKQSFNDVFFYKATHDLEWFKDLLSRFFNSAARCEAIVKEVINEKKPSAENNQRTRTAVNTLKGLKDGGIICESEGEIHNVDNYSDINLSNPEH